MAVGTLRENVRLKGEIESKVKALYSELLDCDEKLAVEYMAEYLEKLLGNKKHDRERQLAKQIHEISGMYDESSKRIRKEVNADIDRIKYRGASDIIAKGDILFVKYGVGYGDELRKGHYGIILARRGFLYLTAPLTKTIQPYGALNISFVGLGLPGESIESRTSYISFNHIRFVHLRRLEKIQGIQNGKRHVSDSAKLELILENYYKLMKNSKV